ncbi:pyridoxal phosphate-dependent aminotransferase [Nakamurella lactea]|uniref:pyridoxal phosphate-dependent aminotransferase n=1 Tax=Nakamurella lactea TaxID=459515 RepID=UPI00042A1765|nr:aminotransferase class I/II-fold pyridoxal phosphate-dependent enzyme [Nakamurella lactea]
MSEAGPSFGPSTRSNIDPFRVMQVLAAAEARRASGDAVFALTAGQPATRAPKPAIDAVHRALDEQVLGYTQAPGLPELRAGIAALYCDRYGLDVDPDAVYLTTGSSSGFILAFLSAFDTGDRVAMARPGYPAYRNALTAFGCELVEFACGPETRFQPTVAMLQQYADDGIDLDGLVLASPANPTGSMLPPAEVDAIARYCGRNGIRLISDEIYHGITYGTVQQACSWASDRTGFVVNSFSKYHSMTGWRIGWLLVPDDLRDRVDALAGNLTICPPAVSQVAALGALQATAECDAHVVRYAANRELLLDGLTAIGIDKVAPPDGAFYLYADISALTPDSSIWAAELLAATGVAVVPGLDFDLTDGHRFIRMCFAGDEAEIRGALAGLRAFVSD